MEGIVGERCTNSRAPMLGPRSSGSKAYGPMLVGTIFWAHAEPCLPYVGSMLLLLLAVAAVVVVIVVIGRRRQKLLQTKGRLSGLCKDCFVMFCGLDPDPPA